MSSLNTFVANNWRYLAALIFGAGGFYLQNDVQTKDIEGLKELHTNEIKEIKQEKMIVEQRLSKKIKIMDENSKEIVSLKIDVAVLSEQIQKCKNK